MRCNCVCPGSIQGQRCGCYMYPAKLFSRVQQDLDVYLCVFRWCGTDSPRGSWGFLVIYVSSRRGGTDRGCITAVSDSLSISDPLLLHVLYLLTHHYCYCSPFCCLLQNVGSCYDLQFDTRVPGQRRDLLYFSDISKQWNYHFICLMPAQQKEEKQWESNSLCLLLDSMHRITLHLVFYCQLIYFPYDGMDFSHHSRGFLSNSFPHANIYIKHIPHLSLLTLSFQLCVRCKVTLGIV